MKNFIAVFALPLVFASSSYARPVVPKLPEELRAVNTTVYTDLSKKFADASEVRWSSKDNFTFVYLKEKGQPVRVAYNKQNKWMYTIRYFDGNTVPVNYSNTLVKNGFTQPISSVTVVERRYGAVALVKLKHKNSLISVQILANGEVVEVQ